MPLAELAALTTVCAAGKTGVKKARDFCRERRGIRCLDNFEQTFKDRLEKYLREYLLDTSELDDDLTDDILNRIKINSDQIFEPLAHADGQRGVTGETRDKLIDSVFDELETVILDTEGIPDPAPAEIQQTLRPAIETAYRNAMTEYLNSIDDDADRATLTVLTDIREGMDQLKNSLSYRPELFGEQLYNRVVISDTDTDTQHAITQAKESLGVSDDDDDDVADQQLRFLDRDIHSELTDLAQQYQLIIGRKGSGKTRTLAESIDPLLKTGEITEVVTLSSQGGIPDETALAPLAETQSHPQGGMLILWDDIHKTDTDVVTSALGTLTDALNSEGRSLYLRATVRQRRLADFLPESLSRESLERSVDRGSKHELLQRFSPVDVPLLDEQSIEELLTRASEAFELEMSADVREDLAEKVREADPTPFYIRSFCEMQTARPGQRQRQRQGSTRVTAADVREFPQTAVDSWKNAYEDLEGTKPQQDLLKILVILSEFGASSSSSFGVGLVKIMYREGFVETTPSAQEAPARGVDELCERLAQAGWVRVARARRGSEVIGERKLSIHDVQLEAVAAQFGFEETHESVSECLRRLTPDPAGAGTGNRNRNRGIHRLAGKHAPTLAQMMANYASTVQRKQLSMMFSDPIDEARELFDGAVALLESGSGSGSGSETPVSVHRQYAEFLQTHGDHGEVTEQYERALTGTPAQGTDTSPSLSGVYSEYADYLKPHDPAAAEEIYKKGIDATGYLYLYEEYADFLEDRNPEKAEKIYQDGIDATGDWRLYREYAGFLRREDRPSDAEKIYQDGIDATGDEGLYLRYLLDFLEDRDPEKAEKIYQDGIDATGGVMLYVMYAEFLRREDRPSDAEKIYQDGIDATGDSYLYSSYADFLRIEDRPSDAEKIYQDGIDATGDVSLYLRYAGFLADEDRNPEKAAKIYQDGIDAGHNLYSAYADFLADEDRNPEKAAKIYQDGIDATGSRRLYRKYADFLRSEDRPSDAEKIYQDGIDATGDSDLYEEYADFLADEDRNPEKAAKIYQDGIDATGDVMLYREYADFLADEDRDPEKAAKIYEEGIDAGHNLYWKYADFLADEDRDPEKAEKIYQDGIDATGDVSLYKEYARFLRREDRPSDAEKIYQDGIDATGDEFLYVMYADFLRREDRPSDAEKIYQDGIDATGATVLYEEYADFLRSEDRPSDAEKIYQDGIDVAIMIVWILYSAYADFLRSEDRPSDAEKIYQDGIDATGDSDLYEEYADFLRSEDRPSDAEKIYQDGIDAGHWLYEEYADFLADEDRDPEKAAQILRDGIAATGDPSGDLTDKYEALAKEYDCEFDSDSDSVP